MTELQLTRLPFGTDFELIRETIDRDGGVIIENFASDSLIDSLNETLEPHFVSTLQDNDDESRESFSKNAGAEFFPKNYLHIYGLVAKAPKECTEMLRNPLHRQIMDQYLNGSYSFYIGGERQEMTTGWILNTVNGMRSYPGSKPQPLHRDQQVHVCPQYGDSTYTTMMGCLVAGSDTFDRNGATRVIPRSHLWPWDRVPTWEETVPVELRKGDALLWLGSVYHAAGHNQTEPGEPGSVRTLYGFFGTRDWLRSEENMMFSNPWDKVKDLPTDILARCGWAKSATGCNFIDLGHPIDKFKPLAEYRTKSGFDDSSVEQKAMTPVKTKLSGASFWPFSLWARRSE